jgi:hypothetical protein
LTRRPSKQDRRRGDDDLVRARLQRDLEFLELTRTRDEHDEHLTWAAHEPRCNRTARADPGIEAAHKLEQRITRRIAGSSVTAATCIPALFTMS